MGNQIIGTRGPLQADSQPALRPLQRQADKAPVPASKGDRYVGSTKPVDVTTPAGRKTMIALGLTPGPGHTGKAATLDEAFDSMVTVGGGKADVRVLSKNLDAWNARWDMMVSAKTSVDASYFSLEKDVFGHAFLGAMLKKQMDGVPVRVMTDAMADTFGQRGFKMAGRGRDYLQEIVNHGGKAYIYNPIALRPGHLISGGYAVMSSNHDKVLVIDGQRSVTGGRNIGIDYLTEGADRKGAWRDMDIELTGAGPAKGLTAALEAEIGDGSIAKPVGKDAYNWSKKDIQLLGAYEMMNLWLNDPAMSEPQKARLRQDPAARAVVADQLVSRALVKVQADLPVNLRREPSKDDIAKLKELAGQLVEQTEARGSRQKYLANRLPEHATETKIIDQTSAAANKITNGIAPALKKLVDSASKSIVIQNPYVVLTEDMIKSLEAASKRGVKIDIITNSPLSTDSDVTQAFFLEDWPMVLARCENARIFVATGERKFHTKSAVIDGEQSFVSTYNLDLLSGKVNSEVGAVVKSPEVAADLLNEFKKDMADKSNGFLEYTIKKDPDGRAVLNDGKPVVKFGPEHHLPADVQEVYKGKRKFWGETMRNKLPQMAPLRHPERIVR
jgi:putative cardiolipin synthase